jgi:hypothetical protein
MLTCMIFMWPDLSVQWRLFSPPKFCSMHLAKAVGARRGESIVSAASSKSHPALNRILNPGHSATRPFFPSPIIILHNGGSGVTL